ncbi:rod shape-determining protein MreC [Veillonella montpellierensis]|uniref:rod shape-determining protein MreC n=1 Tax=Veillonella montpellierensis TaxID=187328 RepID=UPI0023F6936D|nr:rod shape-determining protein MreC [Veillonella montpellierensis]
MFSSERKLITFIAIACILLGLLGYAWKQRTHVPFVTVTLEQITTPFSYGASTILRNLHTGIEVIDNAIGNTTALSDIEQERDTMAQKVVDYNEVVAENIRLRQLLNFEVAHPEFDMVVATVVTKDYGNWTNTFTIDRGAEEGIAINMPVFVPSGVVGFVTDVFPHSSRVQTIFDPRTSIGVIVQRPESRIASVMKGNGNNPTEPIMVNIAKDGDILEGDTLITSGYGGIYPKGFPVGHIKKLEIDSEGFVKNAIVDANVNVRNIEEVFVIIRSSVTAPNSPKEPLKLVPQTQRDQLEGVKGAVKQ